MGCVCFVYVCVCVCVLLRMRPLGYTFLFLNRFNHHCTHNLNVILHEQCTIGFLSLYFNFLAVLQ